MPRKTKIIAEIAQGYEGDVQLCRRFVKLAAAVGADGVKFQIFWAKELSVPGYKHHELFESLEISPKDWESIIEDANRLGIGFYADVFGLETYEWISKCKLAGIKIHGTDLRNYPLLRALHSFPGEVLLSCGGGTEEEIRKALETMNHPRVTLLSGFQAEPNQLEDIELTKIKLLADLFKIPVGYADHVDATTPLATVLPAMAVLAGASVIEKHLTMERDTLKLEDYISALDPREFKAMIDYIEAVDAFPRPEAYALSARETVYRKQTKKVPVVANAMRAGEKLRDDQMMLVRVKEPPKEIMDAEFFVGKTLTQDLSQFSSLTPELVQ